MKNYIKTLLFSLLILGSAVVFCSCNSSDDDAFPLHSNIISSDNVSDTPENSRYIFKRAVITKDDGEIINEYIEITDKRDNSKKKLPFEPQRENVSIYGLFPTEKYLYYGTQGHKSELLTIERLDLDSFSTETLYESTRTADIKEEEKCEQLNVVKTGLKIPCRKQKNICEKLKVSRRKKNITI